MPSAPVTAEIVALPFDPAALLDSLALAATNPPPAFPELETELRAFRARPPAELGEAGARWIAARDSLVRLADSLRALDRDTPGYRAAYGRFRALYSRLAQLSAARDVALRNITGEVRDLASRAGRAADSLRRWESVAYAAFDSLAAARIRDAGREAVRAVPGADGVAALELAGGAWWIALHLPVPDNPFLEREWLRPVVSRAGLPFGIPLSEENASVRWRH